MASDIAQYIRWMEHEYSHGSTSPVLNIDTPAKDDWYFRRVSWLHRLVTVLEISTKKIADSMRNMPTPYKESKRRPINVEECIKHFLQSWKVWEERRPSPVGEVETPAGSIL